MILDGNEIVPRNHSGDHECLCLADSVEDCSVSVFRSCAVAVLWMLHPISGVVFTKTRPSPIVGIGQS